MKHVVAQVCYRTAEGVGKRIKVFLAAHYVDTHYIGLLQMGYNSPLFLITSLGNVIHVMFVHLLCDWLHVCSLQYAGNYSRLQDSTKGVDSRCGSFQYCRRLI